MTDLSPQLKNALSQVQVGWTDVRTEAAWSGLGRKRARRAVMRTAVAGVAVMLLAAGGVYAKMHLSGDPTVVNAPTVTPPPTDDDQPAPGELRLDDGSVITPADDSAAVELVADTPARAQVRVVSGRSEFAMASSERPVTVTTEHVEIEVHATRFAVARFDAGSEVYAYDGYLRVHWEDKVHEVREGEFATFPPQAAEPGQTDDTATDRERDAEMARTAPAAPTARERRDVTALLREADEARASGRPADAVPPLRTVLRSYASDPRAPLAAFTLGRVLLDDLDDPEAAARAFRNARSLAPRGALAEDALAREVEAWSRAGDTAKARERAELYIKRYPNGHRVKAVRQYAGE